MRRWALGCVVVALGGLGCGGALRSGGASGGGGCDDDMVLVSPPGVCVDRFEASRGNGDKAASTLGAMPWVDISWRDAQSACEAAGKRLCTADEWHAACAGPPPGRAYPFGEKYDPQACNAEERGTGAVVPTGSLKGCAGGVPGLFDLAGNVWEWVGPCANGKCPVRGGSFKSNGNAAKCGAATEILARGTDEAIGFRCCRRPDR